MKEKRTFKEIIKSLWKSKKGKGMVIAIASVLVIAIVCTVSYNFKAKINSDLIIACLEESNELTTAKLHFKGVSEFEDEGIAFINKSSFIMVYEATARAGIEIQNVEVSVDDINKTVWLTIPKAVIQEVNVDNGSIRYFDEQFSLFNVNEKEDANKAVALAEEEAKKEISTMGILELADKQSEALLKGLIEDAVPNDYDIKVKK